MAFKDYSREKFDSSLFLNSLFDGWKCQAAEISISGHFETHQNLFNDPKKKLRSLKTIFQA